jgi:hypothetical protein
MVKGIKKKMEKYENKKKKMGEELYSGKNKIMKGMKKE